MIIFYKIYSLIIGHLTVFIHSLKKAVTREYPFVRQHLPAKFRGRPDWDVEKCINCKICEKVCPSSAVNITKTDDNLSFKLDLNKCIFCGNCAYNCPKQSITMSKEYELASDKKSSLYIEINSLNSNMKVS